MRIALVSREYPPETGWGGIGTYAHRLAHALASLGHEVHIVSRSERLEEYVRADGPVTVHRIREKKWSFPAADAVYWSIPLSEWMYSRRLKQKILELHATSPFDVVEVPEYRAEAFHLIYKAPMPVVVKLHTPSYVLNHALLKPWSLREWLIEHMERRLAYEAAAISCPSGDLLRRVREDWQLEPHRMSVIPNPADASLAEPQPWPPAEAPPTLLYVGRINLMKGSDILGEAIVGALKAVPDARFILVGAPGDKTVIGGDQALFEKIQSRWRQAGVLDRVEVVGWQKDASKMREFYRRSHVVVMPSRYDNFPNVLLEAMACGRAVVGSAVGGIAEIVQPHATGLLVPPTDASALQEALIHLLRDLPKARRFGESASRIIAQRLAPVPIARQTVVWYEQVIHARRRCREGSNVLALSTERWIDWRKDEGVAIVVPQFLAGLECHGMRVRLIRRPYQPKHPGRWGNGNGAAGRIKTALDILGDLIEIPRNLFFVLWRWLKRPMSFQLIWERQSLYGLSGVVLSCLTGKPLVLNVDAPLIEECEQLQGLYFGKLRKAVAREILRGNLSCAQSIHTPSLVLADWLAKDYQMPRAKFHVIPNGVSEEALSHESRLPGELRRPPTVIFLGSLQPWHGCDVLIQAFARVKEQCPEARLLIVGDGKMRLRLAEQTQRLTLNGAVSFLGQVPHQQVPDLLESTDIAVLPYPSLPIPFYFSPIKLFEYMGAGKAIVASRIGQIAEILRDGETARLVTPGSAEELAKALIQMIRLPDRGASLGRRAKELARQFTWRLQSDRVARLCLNALEGANP